VADVNSDAGQLINEPRIEVQFGEQRWSLAYGGIPPPPSALPPFALEILREPSLSEVIGKIYAFVSSNRNNQPLTPYGISNYSWYGDFVFPSPKREKLYFDVEHGDKWLVKWVRQESDDSGQNVAAGLQHQ
jgi:hypothetical protein